jgi:hypothetical protein
MSFKSNIVSLIVIVGGYHAYNEYIAVPEVTTSAKKQNLNSSEDSYRNDNRSFHCDGRQHCSQMNSRDEAEYFIQNCPNTKMDGDRDGIPCERDSRW